MDELSINGFIAWVTNEFPAIAVMLFALWFFGKNRRRQEEEDKDRIENAWKAFIAHMKERGNRKDD